MKDRKVQIDLRPHLQFYTCVPRGSATSSGFVVVKDLERSHSWKSKESESSSHLFDYGTAAPMLRGEE